APSIARPFAEVRRMLLERARRGRNPFTHFEMSEMERLLTSIESTEPRAWCRAFSDAGRAHAERDEAALAYGCYRLARYPAPTTSEQREAYRRSQSWYLQLARSFEPPLERVSIPWREGDIVADLR